MKFDRRSFLKTLGLATAGTVTLGHLNPNALVAAPGGVPRNFVFCYFNGGWDQLLALDPRDPAKFPKADVPKTGIELGHDLLANTFDDGSPMGKKLIQPRGSKIAFGPAMKNFAKHWKHSCVLRGVMMDTVAHDVGRRYFITGELPSGLAAKGSSWGTRIVAQQGELSAIPNLVIRVETYNQGHPTFATGLKATSASDLITTLQKGPDALSTELRKFLDDFRKSSVNCDPTELDEEGLMSLVQTAQHKAKLLVDSNLGKHFDFLNKNDATMKGIAGRYKITSMNSAEAQAALAYQAIKHELAQTVTIELARGLDTHTNVWNTDQPNRLYHGFNALSQLVTDLDTTPHPKLKGKSLLDNTTIVVFSEFARTPKLNNRDGRDHFLISSALLIGAGVPHNRVIGKTSDKGMTGFMVNPGTGAAMASGGTFLNPQNILASLMKGAGYKYDELRDHGPLDCLIANT